MKLGFKFKKSLAIAALALGVSGSIGVDAASESLEKPCDSEVKVIASVGQDSEPLSKEKIKSLLENVKETRRLLEELNDILDNGLDVMISLRNNVPDLKNLFFEGNTENAELFKECGALAMTARQCAENARKFDLSKFKKLRESFQHLV